MGCEASRERRSKAMEKFVLSLSDQQLVTGLAILIAGSTRPCAISGHHFDIIAALGWFSSTVHLSTLAVLRDYLMNNPIMRNWRVVGMVAMLVFLVLAQTMVLAKSESTVPAVCVFEHFSYKWNPFFFFSRARQCLGPYFGAPISSTVIRQ